MSAAERALADARARILRYTPEEARERASAGSVIVDLRSHDERVRDGVIPGSVHVPRSMLEWRIDPGSGFCGFQGWLEAGFETIAAAPLPHGLPGMGGPEQ